MIMTDFFFLNNCCPRFVIFSFLKACLCLKLPPFTAVAQRSHTCMNTFSTFPFLLCPASRYPPGQKPHLPPLFLFLCLLGRTQYVMVLYFFFSAFCSKQYLFFAFLDISSWAHRPSLFWWGPCGFAAGHGGCKWYLSVPLSYFLKNALLSHMIDSERVQKKTSLERAPISCQLVTQSPTGVQSIAGDFLQVGSTDGYYGSALTENTQNLCDGVLLGMGLWSAFPCNFLNFIRFGNSYDCSLFWVICLHKWVGKRRYYLGNG